MSLSVVKNQVEDMIYVRFYTGGFIKENNTNKIWA